MRRVSRLRDLIERLCARWCAPARIGLLLGLLLGVSGWLLRPHLPTIAAVAAAINAPVPGLPPTVTWVELYWSVANCSVLLLASVLLLNAYGDRRVLYRPARSDLMIAGTNIRRLWFRVLLLADWTLVGLVAAASTSAPGNTGVPGLVALFGFLLSALFVLLDAVLDGAARRRLLQQIIDEQREATMLTLARFEAARGAPDEG